MQSNSKKYAFWLLMVTIMLAIVWGAERETAGAKSSELSGQENVLFSDQAEEQEKRDAFDKRFAERKARFDKEYNEVKQMGDQIKEKFRNCRTPSEEELRAAIAKDRRKCE